MNDTTHFYLTAAALALALALQMTYFWWRRRDHNITYWVLSSWALVLSDFLFLFHTSLPNGVAEVLPTILVTAAYCFALFGSQFWAGRKPATTLLWLFIVVHGLGLYFVFRHSTVPYGRMVYNRLFWVGLAIASIVYLQKASPRYRMSLNSPAAVMYVQALWLGLRIILAMFLSGKHHPDLDKVIQYLEQANVILFDTMLFASVLLAQLDLRIEEASHAQAEVTTLSRLLPVCAWCKQVRDDDGYWSELTEYLEQKNLVKITHGICQQCMKKMGLVPK